MAPSTELSPTLPDSEVRQPVQPRPISNSGFVRYWWHKVTARAFSNSLIAAFHCFSIFNALRAVAPYMHARSIRPSPPIHAVLYVCVYNCLHRWRLTAGAANGPAEREGVQTKCHRVVELLQMTLFGLAVRPRRTPSRQAHEDRPQFLGEGGADGSGTR
jgi:hypothetical protein